MLLQFSVYSMYNFFFFLSTHHVPPQFLVGMRGKDEAMAIGGHWSPTLDGADPENDASVLIKTAIRCCKALTGIDLSLCTQW